MNPSASASAPLRIYVSAHPDELSTARETIRQFISSLGAEMVTAEFGGTLSSEPTVDRIRGLISGSDAVLHFAGLRTGPVLDPGPDGSTRTLAQAEISHARALGKPLYLFICSERYPFDLVPDEIPAQEKELQSAHRAAVAQASETRCRLALPVHLDTELARLAPRLERLRGHRRSGVGRGGVIRWVAKLAALVSLSAAAGAGWAWLKTEDRSASSLQALVELSARPEIDLPRPLTLRWKEAIAEFAATSRTGTGTVEGAVADFVEQTRQDSNASPLHKALAAYAVGNTAEAHAQAGMAAQALADATPASSPSPESRAALFTTWRLAGDAASAANDFRSALQHYERAALLVDRETSPANWSEVQFRKGEALLTLGRSIPASEVLSAVFEERKTRLGGEHEETIAAAIILINSLVAENRKDDAWTTGQYLVSASEKAWGANHPRLATALVIQSRTANNSERFREAEALVDRALKIDRAALGGVHPHVFRDQLAAAIVHLGLGRPTAEEALRKVAQDAEQSLGPLHPQVILIKRPLSLLLLQRSRVAEAEELLKTELADCRKAFGEDHMMTAAAAGALAQATLSLPERTTEEKSAAVDLATQLLVRLVDEDHPSRISMMVLRSRLVAPAEAEALLRRAIELTEKRSFSPQDELANLHIALGDLLKSQRRFPEAVKVLLRARREAEGKPQFQRHLGLIVRHLADLYNEQSQLPEAETAYREARDLEKQLNGADHPSTLNLTTSLALAIDDQGRHAEAEKLFREVLATREQKFGKDDPELVTVLNNLGSNLDSQGRPAEAEPFLRRALTLIGSTTQPDLKLQGFIEGHLATTLKALGKPDEAAIFYRRAVSTAEKIPGSRPENLVMPLNNLGNFLREQGKVDEGEALLQRALTLGEASLGPSHPDVILVLGNMAIIKTLRGQYAEAEVMQRRVVDAKAHSYGSGHPATAHAKQNLASILARMGGRADDALLLSQEALTAQEKSMGSDHLETARQMSEVAGYLATARRYPEAEKLALRALEIRLKALGNRHLDVASSHSAVARIYKSQARLPDAEKHFREALDITSQVVGNDHPLTASCIEDLARLRVEQSKFEEADQGFRAAIAILKSTNLQYEERDLARLYDHLGNVLDFKGTHLEAESMKRHALEIYERILGKDHPTVADVVLGLGVSIKRQGRFDEAEALYRRALEMLEKIYGAGHGKTAEPISYLAGLLMAQKRHPEAIQLYRRALEIEEKYFGPSSLQVSRDLANMASMLPPAEAHPLMKRAMVIHARHRMKNGTNDVWAESAMDLYLEVLKKLRYTREQSEAEWKALEQEAAREP